LTTSTTPSNNQDKNKSFTEPDKLNIPYVNLLPTKPTPQPSTAPTPVIIVRGDETHPDAIASKYLIDACRTNTGYKCIKCGLEMTELSEIAQHLEFEINDTFSKLQEITTMKNPDLKKSLLRSQQQNNEKTSVK
jgi:hypothetical protein